MNYDLPRAVILARSLEGGPVAGWMPEGGYGGADEDLPECFLVADGSVYDPAEYPELKLMLRDAYGVNRLPDMRGRVL